MNLRHNLLASGSAILLAGCLATGPSRPERAETPVMRPEAFFAGRTEGRGELDLLGRAPRPFRVVSHGRAETDGAFHLEQTITYGDGEVERRTFRLVQSGADTYTGTLSNAAGPVRALVEGNLFHLRYRVRFPAIYMEQWLYLQPDRKTVHNYGRATVLGIPLGGLVETIVKSD